MKIKSKHIRKLNIILNFECSDVCVKFETTLFLNLEGRERFIGFTMSF